MDSEASKAKHLSGLMPWWWYGGPRTQVSHPLPDLGHNTTQPCLHRSTLRELKVSPAGTNRHWTYQKGISHFLSFTASATLKRISIHRRARGMIVIVSLERILGNRNMSNSKEYKEKREKPHLSSSKSKNGEATTDLFVKYNSLSSQYALSAKNNEIKALSPCPSWSRLGERETCNDHRKAHCVSSYLHWMPLVIADLS